MAMYSVERVNERAREKTDTENRDSLRANREGDKRGFRRFRRLMPLQIFCIAQGTRCGILAASDILTERNAKLACVVALAGLIVAE